MVAHPTRQPLQKKDVTTMMGTIQRQLRLQPGGDGGWNEEAQGRLENLLANPKRTGKRLALEDKKSEDKKPASDSPCPTSAELEKMKAENADQRMLIDSLIEENSNLRRQLEAHGYEDVSICFHGMR